MRVRGDTTRAPTQGPRPKRAARCRPVFALRDWYEGEKSNQRDNRSLPYLPPPETPFHAEPLHSVKVQEIAPPWVQTDLLNSNDEPRAMPLAAFISETMKALAADANEVLVELARPMRNNPGPNEAAFVKQFNDMMMHSQ
jgi:hypothetical protein